MAAISRRVFLRVAAGTASLASSGVLAACGSSAASAVSNTSQAPASSSALAVVAPSSRAGTTTAQTSTSVSAVSSMTASVSSAATPTATQAAAAPAGAPVNLQVLSFITKPDPTFPSDRFVQQHPNTKVELLTAPPGGNSFEEKVVAVYVSGTALDVIQPNTTEMYADLAVKKILLPLDPLVATSKLDTSGYGDELKTMAYQGSSYILPLYRGIHNIYYNDDLLAKNGIAAPQADWTWDTLREAAKKSTQASAGVYGIGAPPWPTAYLQQGIQKGAWATIPDNFEPFASGLSFWHDVQTVDGSFPPADPKNSAVFGTDINPFQQGKFAFIYCADYLVGTLQKAAAAGKTTVRWNVAPMPVPSGIAAHTCSGNLQQGLTIAANTKQKEAAWTFLTWMTGPVGSEIIVKEGQRLTGWVTPEQAQWFQAGGSFDASVFFQAKLVQEDPVSPLLTKAYAVFQPNVAKYLQNQQSLDTGIAAINAGLKALKAANASGG